ncbi:MAG: hypothetical protein WBA07_08720, partial [Rivularia sp. (in: cyanobacteria)]
MFLKAWFIPDDTIQDPWERFKPLTVDEQQPKISFVPEELPQLLSNLFGQCFEEYLQGQPTELTIEVFLPRDRLHDEVEKWSYPDEEGFDINIGEEYRVVVRSYERLKKLRTQQGSYWRENWEKVKLILILNSIDKLFDDFQDKKHLCPKYCEYYLKSQKQTLYFLILPFL